MGSFISLWRIFKKGIKFKIQERKFVLFHREKIHFSLSENFISDYKYKPCFICFSLLKFCCSGEGWEHFFIKEWEGTWERDSTAFLLWFLGKMDFRNSPMQGKNGPRPQHYGCVSRISLGDENAESKVRRKLSLRGSCWKCRAPNVRCSVPPAPSCSSAGGKVVIVVFLIEPLQWEGLRKKSEWENLCTQHNWRWEEEGTQDSQIKSRLIIGFTLLVLCARQNLCCHLINIFVHLLLPWARAWCTGCVCHCYSCIFQGWKTNIVVNELNY